HGSPPGRLARNLSLYRKATYDLLPTPPHASAPDGLRHDQSRYRGGSVPAAVPGKVKALAPPRSPSRGQRLQPEAQARKTIPIGVFASLASASGCRIGTSRWALVRSAVTSRSTSP